MKVGVFGVEVTSGPHAGMTVSLATPFTKVPRQRSSGSGPVTSGREYVSAPVVIGR